MGNDTRCTLQGTLRGIICARLNVLDLIADAEIIAVLSERKEASAEGLPGREEAQNLKSVLRRVEPRELEAAVGGTRLVMRGRTGQDGSFCLVERRYEKGLLDVYAVIASVPLHGREPRQVALRDQQILYLGTYDLHGGSHLDVVIPQPVWCRIKRVADVWTIAGRVSACDDRSVAIGGVKVTAFDVDWLQDDNLGTATTSSAGIFRIDYLGEKYRKGTFIDVELFGGPDVYFRIEDADGNPLLVEDPKEGRKPGRADSGPCLCVELCVKVPVPGPQTTYSLWTSVGSFTIPDASGLNDFDADGYAGAAKYGFTNTIHLSGTTAPNTQYRFLVSDATTANGAAPPADGDFTRIVGVSPDDNLFTPFHIGDYYRFAPFKILKIFAKAVDLDTQGWLDVNAAITRTFAENPALDRSTFNAYVPTGRLALLNTAQLTHQPSVPDGAALPGQPVPAANLIAIEKVAVRFEVRDATSHAALPGSGTTLNSMIVNNNPAFLKLAMTEHLTSNPCAILSGSIHVAYTGYHPHLEAISISVQSNSGAYDVDLQDPVPPPPPPLHLPLAGNTNPAFVQLSNPALALPNSPPNVLVKCTYLVRLFVTRRLFTSWEDSDGALYQTPVGTDWIWTTFYYEP
jgi:hypothetical protein